ncbi:MAG TPA: hypothetical protein PLO69_11160 [Gammaproteobacteria bacterium]|nr:hypothetical protein [Gammaproteobacteria bacterium]
MFDQIETLVPIATLLAAQQDTYAAQPKGEVIDAGCDRAVITHLPNATLLSIAGTRDLAGWLSDFQVWKATLRDHPDVGPVEAGFGDGADKLWQRLAGRIDRDKPLLIQGHSRGAAMVPILAAFALIAGIKPYFCFAYEAPWSVGPACRDLLLAHRILGLTWWHGNDPVPLAPAVSWLVPHVWPCVSFGTPRENPIDCHYFEAVAAALAPTAEAPHG